jgi:hypothetical protein
MELTASGVDATLTFGGTPFDCHLPWPSVYLVVSHVTGQPFLFPADVPGDIPPFTSSSDNAPTPRETTPHFEVVAGEGGGEGSQGPSNDAAEGDGEKAPPSKAKRGHLRVVK